MDARTAAVIAAIVLVLDVLMICLTYGVKFLRSKRSMKTEQREASLQQLLLTDKEADLQSFQPSQLMKIYIKLEQTVRLPEDRRREIREYLLASSYSRRQLGKLRSFSYIKRAESAWTLKYLPSPAVREALLNALRREIHPLVILHIADALAAQGVTKAISPIVRKLPSMNLWYAQRIHAVLYTFGKHFLRYAVPRLHNSRIYMQRLFCGFAADYPAEELRPFLLQRAWSKNRSVNTLALQALIKHFPEELRRPPFTDSRRRHIAAAVIEAYGKEARNDHVELILAYSGQTAVHEHIIQALSAMAAEEPKVLAEVLRRFNTAHDNRKKTLLAKVLSNRIEYYLTRIISPMQEQVVSLIEQLVKADHISGILIFLNRNQDKEIEQKLAAVLQELMSRHKKLRREMNYYLHPEKLSLFFLKQPKADPPQPAPHQDPTPRGTLLAFLAAVFVLFPVLIFGTNFSTVSELAWREIGRLYVVRFNYLFVFYSAAVNSTYLIILAVSLRAAGVQSRLWNIKDRSLLFTRHLLPAVSIVAPAYNESASIIESTNSLLNQQFPDFELIVVNDGSKDHTLNTLIEHFELEKQDRLISRRLKTRPLRGVYTNRNIPNLIVVDKTNGGKADSLNMGINVSSKEFFCGIDADSLLEPDALLKSVSVMLDTPEESFAAGGNIFPVNGCTVDHGSLEQISLPKQFLPRLQSLEYIRAFMAGRVGWAYLNSLLIISGAFGIFDREFAVRSGGYLTKSGKYHRDTVGEDMELVVRITRQLRERGIPYRVDYAFHSNCWTEVPETWKSLHRQRSRWHRGLIDIMLMHRRLIANPRYGRLGMVSMLYYFLFEFIGPFIETKGIILVAVSFMIGVINPPMALLLFTATVLLGILVSSSAVFISEFSRPIYHRRDVAKLLRMAVIENFGIRQYISFWRVQAYFSAMKGAGGWGAQTRRGFASSQPSATAPTDQTGKSSP